MPGALAKLVAVLLSVRSALTRVIISIVAKLRLPDPEAACMALALAEDRQTRCVVVAQPWC